MCEFLMSAPFQAKHQAMKGRFGNLLLLFFIPYFMDCFGGNIMHVSVGAADLYDEVLSRGLPTRLQRTKTTTGSRKRTKWQQRTTPWEGLTVRIKSALDPTYNSYFTQAIQKWENASQLGAPHSVRFIVSILPSTQNSRQACQEGVYGEIIMCSDDYGATLWAGLEVTISDGDYIVKSIVKINDYYMKQAAPDYKQYALCHEIGHSLGLRRNDANFHNKGKESCMDSTAYVSTNSHAPNKSDYDKLTQMYGKLNLSTQLASSVESNARTAMDPSSNISVTPNSNPENISPCCSYNEKICGMAPHCDSSKSVCEETCAGFWLEGEKIQSLAGSNCTGLSGTCTIDAECCGDNSICGLDVYTMHGICIPGSPTVSPTTRPTPYPTTSPTTRPTKRPVTTAPTDSPLGTPNPTLHSCCSSNNKLCGGMAAYCDSSKSKCEGDCAGFWLNGKARQARGESNCMGISDICTIDAECCGNSLCKLDYKGCNVCVPGPPTSPPTKFPTAFPTKTYTSPPTLMPVTVIPTEAPTGSPPCCSYNNKDCGGMVELCDSKKSICETACSGYWLDGKAWQSRARSNCIGISDICTMDAECCGNSLCKLDVYRGYNVCVTGPPTLSPTTSPSSVKMNTSKKTAVVHTPSPTSTVTLPSNKNVDSAAQQQHDSNQIIHCFCPHTCTNDVLNSIYGLHTCKSFIDYQMNEKGMPELYACVLVSKANPACGGDSCNPYRCPGSQLRRALQSSTREGDDVTSNTTGKDVHVATPQVAYIPVAIIQKEPRTMNPLNISAIEKDIGYDSETWGKLIKIRRSSLRYALQLANGTTRFTDISLLLVG